MLCACSLGTTPSEVSLLIRVVKKNAMQLTRRAFVVAIVLMMFIFWPHSVYAEAQAGFESFLVEYQDHRGDEAQHVRKLRTELHHDGEKRSAANTRTFANRKFLRQGTDSADDFTEALSLTLRNLAPSPSPEGSSLSSEGGKFSGGNSKIPCRRILIPATNVCTNKDISISQGPDVSSGIPRYFVQIVNTCMSDCAPSQVHLFCGWFASALQVNPNTFRRLAYNDCLLNGGKPLKYGEIVRYECTNKDISITQRRDGSPGIPRFNVQIVNTCVSDCAPADIHVYCGWFASSPPPNPNTFQRVSYNDCLVNGGRPLGHGAIIQFQYANSFMYPIRFRSARFCR